MRKPPVNFIEQLADTWEPRMRDAFLRAIQQVQNRVDIAALTRLLEKGDVADALRAVGLEPADFSNFALVHQQAYNDGGSTAARAIPAIPQPGGYSLQILFDVRNLGAEQWIRDRSSTLITEIVDDQRVTIRNYLEKGLVAGQNPRTVALDLVGRISPATRQRTGGVIGLHSTQEQWLANYEADLASSEPDALKALLGRGLRDKRFDASVLKAIKDGTGLSADLQSKMRTAYANKALKWRADSISRTETIRALGAAQRSAYQQGIDSGKLDVSLITRFPVTAGDERVRPTHMAVPGMNPDGRKWNEPFATPFGPQMSAPYPTEIMCRCHERIRVDFLAPVAKRMQDANG